MYYIFTPSISEQAKKKFVLPARRPKLLFHLPRSVFTLIGSEFRKSVMLTFAGYKGAEEYIVSVKFTSTFTYFQGTHTRTIYFSTGIRVGLRVRAYLVAIV